MKYLLMLLLTSCAANKTVNDPRDITGIHPEVVPFVTQFEQLLGHSIGDTPIQLVELSYDIAGVCETWTNGYREVKISTDWWIGADLDAKRAMVFHELGHCILGRAHDNDTFVNNTRYVPVSYMYYRAFFTFYLDDMKPYYDNELFHSINVPMLKQRNTINN